MKHRISLGMLFLMSILIFGAIATDKYSAPDNSGLCGTSESKRKGAALASDASTDWTDVCVPDGDLVEDCYVYDRVNGGCFCDSQDSYVQRDDVLLASKTVKACVPPAQDKFNGVCTKLGTKSYSCVCSSATYKVDVKLASSDTDNVIGVKSACVAEVEVVVNCDQYELVSKTRRLLGAFQFTLSLFDIKCKSCKSGFQAFSTDNPTGYKSGIGCPADLSYETGSCKTMTYDSAFGYKCSCADTQTWTKFTATKTAPIAQACITTTSFTNIDENCDFYTYNTVPAKIYCGVCTYDSKATTQFRLVNITGADSGQLFKVCMTSSQVPGCSDYFASEKPEKDATLVCYKCQTDYDYIPTLSSVKIDGVSTMSTGICLSKGRWLIETNYCSQYAVPTKNSDGVITDLSLTCVTDKCVIKTNNQPPCYAGTPKANQYSGSCTGGALNVKAGDKSDSACISTGIVQNCRKYATFTSGTKTASGACLECEDGFTLVDTQLSKPSDEQAGWLPAKKICLPNTLLDSKCVKYSNNDFSCLSCTNGLTYNYISKRCNFRATDATAECSKAVYVGSKLTCVVCAGTAVLVNGVCVPRIPFCGSLSTNGVCSSCVGGFQLINNQCVQKPSNCDQINEKGACVQCKSGLTPNAEGKCVYSGFNGQNLCPAGQVLSNGVCVPVQVKIDGCIQYTIDSMCEQCAQGKRPSEDKSKCVDASEKPGAKPCPPNTNTVIYKRNPSDPLGGCVAVDVDCAYARDDGHCIGCKDGEYAHTDGKCYKVNLFIEGN